MKDDDKDNEGICLKLATAYLLEESTCIILSMAVAKGVGAI
jgi:hypothetical protein